MQNIASMISAPREHAATDARAYFNVLEKMSVKKLGKIVNGSIKAISVITNIKKNDVIQILGKVHVAALNEVQEAVENLEGIEGIDTVKLTVGIEETIKAIADITHLDVDEVTGILAKNDGASVEDIVNRLHAKSRTA